MKKILIIAMFSFSMFLLAGFSNAEVYTTIDGNNVVMVESGSYSNYEEVSDDQQTLIINELSELKLTPINSSSDESQSITNNYSIKLTYDTNDGCIIQFNFEDLVYSITPFNSDGSLEHDESKIYSAQAGELIEIESLYY